MEQTMDLPDPEPFHENVSKDEFCPWCHEGWVYLGGTLRVGNGPTYSLGVVACQWCERGDQHRKATDNRGRVIVWPPYKPEDVDPGSLPTSGKDHPSKAEVRAYLAKIQATLNRAAARTMPPGPILAEDRRGMPHITRGPQTRQPAVDIDTLADYVGEEPPPP